MNFAYCLKYCSYLIHTATINSYKVIISYKQALPNNSKPIILDFSICSGFGS